MPTGNAAESDLVDPSGSADPALTGQHYGSPDDLSSAAPARPTPVRPPAQAATVAADVLATAQAVTRAPDPAVESSIATRQTLNLRQRDDERLQRLKDFCGGNANDAIRMSLGVADIVREVINSGGQLVVQHADGRTEALKLVI